jgi:hypothetical protein
MARRGRVRVRVQRSPDRGYAHLIVPCQERYRVAAGVPLGDLSTLSNVERWLATELPPLCLGASDAFLATLADQFSLELRHRAHDGEDQLAMRARGVSAYRGPTSAVP